MTTASIGMGISKSIWASSKPDLETEKVLATPNLLLNIWLHTFLTQSSITFSNNVCFVCHFKVQRVAFSFSVVQIQCRKEKRTGGFGSLAMFPTVPCHSNALSFLLSLLRLGRGHREDIFRNEQSSVLLCVLPLSAPVAPTESYMAGDNGFSVSRKERPSNTTKEHFAY